MLKKILILLFMTTVLFGEKIIIEDTDNDLIPNTEDMCPNTPNGVFVTQDGCTKQIKKTVFFDHASFSLDQEDKLILILIVELLDGTDGYKIDIVGHTDSIADARTNMILSQKRANSVKRFLLNSQINNNMIATSWYGETRPVASNISSEGRSKNRRVDIILK